MMLDRDRLAYDSQHLIADRGWGFKACGVNVRIHPHAIIPRPENIELGDHVRIDAFTVLSARRIVIGDRIHIGPHCSLSGGSVINMHAYSALSHGVRIFSSTDDIEIADHSIASDDRLVVGSVVVGGHVVIGANAVVMPGTVMGYGCYIGALSLVKSDVPPFTVMAGVPAKVVRERKLTVADFQDFERRCSR